MRTFRCTNHERDSTAALAGRTKAGDLEPMVVDSEASPSLEVAQQRLHRALDRCAAPGRSCVQRGGSDGRGRRACRPSGRSSPDPPQDVEPGHQLERAEHGSTADRSAGVAQIAHDVVGGEAANLPWQSRTSRQAALVGNRIAVGGQSRERVQCELRCRGSLCFDDGCQCARRCQPRQASRASTAGRGARALSAVSVSRTKSASVTRPASRLLDRRTPRSRARRGRRSCRRPAARSSGRCRRSAARGRGTRRSPPCGARSAPSVIIVPEPRPLPNAITPVASSRRCSRPRAAPAPSQCP